MESINQFLFWEQKINKLAIRYFLFVLSFLRLPIYGNLVDDIDDVPEWMLSTIEADLSSFEAIPLSVSAIESYFHKELNIPNFYRIDIKDNVFFINSFGNTGLPRRIAFISEALKILSEQSKLPDTTFFLCLGDFLDFKDLRYPIFVMARKTTSNSQILFPDFCALKGEYQVLPNKNLKNFRVDWNKKINKLVWRGATSQGGYTQSTYKEFSRVKLCEISKNRPDLIDAKFSISCQGANKVKELKQYFGKRLTYNELFNYKYQMWIDGNSVSYSSSGWRFFSGSVVIKPNSDHIQWYFNKLEPYVHYLPVSEDLHDLVENIEMLQENDEYARQLAENAYNFALEHLTQEASIKYFYHLLLRYSSLHFVD